jgi:hypothetical protein
MDFLKSDTGKIIISIILGLGISSLFRKVCKDNCIVLVSPDMDEIKGQYFKNNNDCYQYEPYAVKCERGVKYIQNKK